IERLEKFDALLLSDRKILDGRARVNRKFEFIGERANLLRGFIQIERSGCSRLCAEHDVFGDGHRLDEHEMLVHHADTKSDGVMRRIDLTGRTINHDLATIRRVEAVSD